MFRTHSPRKQRVIQESLEHGKQTAPILAQHIHRHDRGLLVAATRSGAVLALVAGQLECVGHHARQAERDFFGQICPLLGDAKQVAKVDVQRRPRELVDENVGAMPVPETNDVANKACVLSRDMDWSRRGTHCRHPTFAQNWSVA